MDQPARRELVVDLLAALVGMVAFLAFCSPRILTPGEVGWLLSLQDPAQHYLSWQFFRETPLAQFPLGLNPRFGTDIGSSIVFSDSLPLLALPLKYGSAVLPRVFQYHGAWILACFVLQGVAARRLLARFVADRPLQLVGSGFFVLAPSMLWRLHGHFSLLAHFLLVGGLALYFSPRFRRVAWLALLAVAVLVHAYLLVLAGGIWLTDLVGRAHARESKWGAVALDIAAGISLVAMLAWAAGYFVAGESVVDVGGFGRFRMNLLSPLDPHREWSRWLPDLGHSAGEYEGFNFLGTGILLLGTVVLVLRRRREPPSSTSRSFVPLAWMAGVMTVYALSNRVHFSTFKVLSYTVPGALQDLVSTFRASGRMFWPVVYLIVLRVLIAVPRRLERRASIGLLVAALTLQAFDLGDVASSFRRQFRAGLEWQSPLKSPFWAVAAARYGHLRIVPPANDPEGFVPLAQLAALHGMTINSGYYGRFDGRRLRVAARREEALLEKGSVDPRALYVFRRREGRWEMLRETRGAPDFVGAIDGYAVFAPGFGPVPHEWQRAPAPQRSPRHSRRRGR